MSDSVVALAELTVGAVSPWLAVAVGRRAEDGRFYLALSAAVAVSLAVDVVYRGGVAPAVAWSPVEVAGIAALGWIALRRPSIRPGPAVALALIAVALLPVRFAADPEGANTGTVILMAILFVGTTGGLFLVAAHLRRRDSQRRREAEERRREQLLEVAADLHDFVGHELTGMILEAQTARPGTDSESAALARIEGAGVRALDSMDLLLEKLRDRQRAGGPSRGIADIPALAERFRSAGDPILVEIDPHVLARLDPDSEGLLYRIALEGITNVRRHAAADARIQISVQATEGGVELRVLDDGGGVAPAARRFSGGSGLDRLGTEVAARRGALTADRSGEGWELIATLPTGLEDLPDGRGASAPPG